MAKFNIKKAIQQAAKLTNLNEATTGGGGSYTPPATGVPGLRFVSYVEIGQQEKTFEGKATLKWMAHLTFELHGKKWPLSDNGQPSRLTVKVTCPAPGNQPHVKSTYYKLFRAMNYEGKYNHFAEMLGGDFVGTVYHKIDAKDSKKVYPGLTDPDTGVVSVRAPFVENEDGDPIRRKVPEAINELRCFLWAAPDADQWASIHIDGEYDDGRSKNTYQNLIKVSPAFSGSPIEALLLGLDDDDAQPDDVAEAKAEAQKKAPPAKSRGKKKPEPEPDTAEDDDSDDPLAGADDEDDIPY